jgi:hypothetical protein
MVARPPLSTAAAAVESGGRRKGKGKGKGGGDVASDGRAPRVSGLAARGMGRAWAESGARPVGLVGGPRR